MRLTREVALVLAVGLAPLVWPLRRPHAGAEDFAVRVPEEPLDGCVALPFGRNPFFELVAECAPFRLAFVGVFEPQRAPEAGREPFAVRRAPEVWDSGLVRRAGRLPLEDCAGLRSREWVEVRLKWGRAAAGFALEAGLRAAGGLEVCDSAAGRGLIEAAGAGGAGIRASNSNASFSWSRERRKLEEANMEELE